MVCKDEKTKKRPRMAHFLKKTLGNYARVPLSGRKWHFSILGYKRDPANCQLLQILFSSKMFCSFGNYPRMPWSKFEWHFSIIRYKTSPNWNVLTNFIFNYWINYRQVCHSHKFIKRYNRQFKNYKYYSQCCFLLKGMVSYEITLGCP